MADVTITVRLKIPTTPNFIQREDGANVSIMDLDDETLRKIGKEWTDALIQSAHGKRNMSRKIAEMDARAAR